MKNLNKKIVILFLNSVFLYGDALMSSYKFSQNEAKYESLDNYGVISTGVQGTTINLLQDDIEVEQGILKKVDIFLYGYSLYTKSSSNYIDIKLVSPSFSGFTSDNPRYSYGKNKLMGEYKRLKYQGLQTGNIDSYKIMLTSTYKDIIGGVDGLSSMDWFRFDYTTMNDDNIDNYSNYYLVGFGGRMNSTEQQLIQKLAKRKLSYDIDFNIFENLGCYIGYGWADGVNPNALFAGGLSFSENDDEDMRDDNKGVVYSFEFNPTLFITFPLGYLKVSYEKRLSIADAISTDGFNASLAIVF